MFFAFRRRRNAQTRFSRRPTEATVVSLVRMVQVDPLVQVDPTLAYAKKYAQRSSCVLNTEQSRGFKCGICLGRRRHAPFRPQRPPFSSLCTSAGSLEPLFEPGSGVGLTRCDPARAQSC